MACTDPGTRSPGRLVLHYQLGTSGQRHTIGWHFIAGVDITNIALLQIEADRLAGLLGPCVPNTIVLTDWSIQRPDGSTYYTAPLAVAVTGTHSVPGNMQQWHSTTVAFVGTGNQAGPGICNGKIIARLHTYGALNFPPGSKTFDCNSDGPYRHFITDGLNASTYLPADFYGGQGDIIMSAPVQWNSATQKRDGS